MTRRRAKFKRHSGKMVKLYKDLFLIFFTNYPSRQPATSNMARRLPCKPSLKSLLVLPVIFFLLNSSAIMNTSQALQQHQSRVQLSSSAQNQQARSRRLNESPPPSSQSKFSGSSTSSLAMDDQEDPMEPCYLANNRASETLTISESTPVGTIVGELLVNGDSSRTGNIELSIKMPTSSNGQTGVSGHHYHTYSNADSDPTISAASSIADTRHPIGTQKYKQTDAHHSTSSTPDSLVSNRRLGSSSAPSSSSLPLRESAANLASQSPFMKSQQMHQQERPTEGKANYGATKTATGLKDARDLSNLIDLMPPLSIDQVAKKLILAKKLDRENLDKYIQAGSYQSSYSSINSLSQVSSASLTVHIKCQLRDRSSLDGDGLGGSGDQQQQELHKNKTASSVSIQYQNKTIATTVATSSGETITSTVTSAKGVASRSQPRSSRAHSILIPIHLIVTDENDNWPNFIGSPYIIDLNESTPVGSLLQGNEIVAVDNDQQGPLSTIEYSIVAGSLWSDSFGFLNPLDARSLIVKDNRLIDYESQPKLTLKVMARDQGEPPNWAITSLYVNVQDQDDLNPVFNEDKYSGFVKDNRPGEVIDLSPKRMVAHDGDRNLNAPLIYSFHMKTNHSIHFDLDPDLGHLSIKKSLPEDELQPFCLLISTSQVDDPRRSTLTAISLRLSSSPSIRPTEIFESLHSPESRTNLSLPTMGATDRHSLKFAQSNYTLEMSEIAQVGSTVLTVRAGHQHRIVYQLLDNELGYLKLDTTTGKLTLNMSLDFEMYRHLSVRVLATLEFSDDDNDETGQPMAAKSTGAAYYPKLACDITRININIINHNEHAPEFSHEQYNFQLSVSDLIANYEPAKGHSDEEQSSTDRMLVSSQTELFKFGRRLGDTGLDESQVDDLGYRAIQLGQVHCADRDFGDKLKLSLNGSKASLFHLTQDGRLYLPLVNITATATGANQPSSQADSTEAQSSWSYQSQKTNANDKFMQISRVFSSTRRADSRADQLDRKYLNYLLGEFSNLGRLRLKVHAIDDGQPEQKQSTALIVITIISIDNFIIQRAQTHQISSNGLTERGSPAHLADANAYQASKASDSMAQLGAGGKYSGQMLIPSTNRRSFVHINSDIIGNLLSNKNHQDNVADKGNSKSDQNKLQTLDSLDSSASNSFASSTGFNGADSSQMSSQTAQARNRFQPPGLLLVDDEGAKFVAMPAAIEVYNQQVQEAADQQVRQHQLQHGNFDKTPFRQSIWRIWKDKLGLDSDNGAIYWINLSTALILHLLVVAVVVSLVARFRSSFRRHEDSYGGPSTNSSHPSRNSWLWSRPRSFPVFGSLFGSKSRRSDPDLSILNNHSASAYANSLANPLSSDEAPANQYSDFMQQHAHDNSSLSGTSTNYDKDTPTNQRRSIISSGVVVSAMANKQKSLSPTLDENNHKSTRQQQQQQQSLFNHLKLTLNKMIDAEEKEGHTEECSIGHISVRPLDSDVVAFEDLRDRQLDVCAQYKETSELQIHQTKKCFEENKSAISTFVGHNNNNNSSNTQGQRANQLVGPDDNGPKTGATIVSISIKGSAKMDVVDDHQSTRVMAKNLELNSKKANLTNGAANSSSNSSVISLVSMGSSLSNKISEAVGRANSDRVTGSDASSLNSSILLNGCRSSGSSSNGASKAPNTAAKSTKAPPAPPPPPPSRVQAIGMMMEHNSRKRASPSLPPARKSGSSLAHKLSNRVGATVLTSASSRQSPPENPVHVRLRRQAVTDQAPLSSPSNGQSQTAPGKHSSSAGRRAQYESSRASRSAGVDQHRAQQHQSSSIVGRREARQHSSMDRAPPTPPPMPTINNDHRHNCASDNAALSASNATTVSPTTSVDRGYESFQSYTSSGGPSSKSRQSNSLLACAVANNGVDDTSGRDYNPINCASSLPNYNNCDGGDLVHSVKHVAGRRYQTSGLVNSKQQNGTTQSVKTFSSPSSQSLANEPVQVHRKMRSSSGNSKSVRKGKTECDTEDDDFFYCCNESSHSSDVHQLSVRGLLTDYASHTYKQQSRPNTKPKVNPSQRLRHEQRSSAPMGGSNYKSSHLGEHYGALNASTNPNNDLIMYCEEQQQQQQQILNQFCDTVHEQHIDTSHGRRIIGARNQGTNRRQRLATGPSSQHQSHYYNLMSSLQEQSSGGGNGYLMKHNGGNKKQLTWSDQVE